MEGLFFQIIVLLILVILISLIVRICLKYLGYYDNN